MPPANVPEAPAEVTMHSAQAGAGGPHVAVEVAEAAGGAVPRTPENTLGTVRAGTVTRTRRSVGSMLTQSPGDAVVPAGRGWGSRQPAQALGCTA